MIPSVALVGRPNVGKSTLFNRLTKTRSALVADFPGLTRDRKYGEATIADRPCVLIDTGGLTGDEEGVDALMADQSYTAIDEADVILFLVEARSGLTPLDEEIANELRRLHKPCILVVNKIDGLNLDEVMADFYALGWKNCATISASHGRGVAQLAVQIEAVFDEIAGAYEAPEDLDDSESGIRIAVAGRPNVGKSTLVNRMLGEERVIVCDLPGTTRDSVYIPYERLEQKYTLIDTAGVRRRKNVSETVEKFSIVKSLQAIAEANVVILLIDGSEGLVDQDLHMLGHVIDAGRAVVIAVNKWDGLDNYQRERVKEELDRRLRFVNFADVHFISALHGSGVGKLYDSIHAAYESALSPLSTSRLTQVLNGAIQEHQPPLVNGRRIKLRYAHAGGKNPPIIVIHGNQTSAVPAHYTRYLEKKFRTVLDLHGTPLKIEFRGGSNPYEGRRNKLTARQISKKRRLMKHVKGK